MSRIHAVVAGLIAGAIGAAAWAAIVYYTGYEVGYVAWGVGFLVGLASKVGSRGAGDVASGVIAAVITVASIGAGKYAATYFIVSPYFSTDASELSEDLLISFYADGVVFERMDAGIEVEWPENANPEGNDAGPDDYPEDIWTEAQERWNAQSEAERQAFRDGKAAEQAELLADATQTQFMDSFSPIDILFLVLGIGTAFRLAAAADMSAGTSPDPEVGPSE